MEKRCRQRDQWVQRVGKGPWKHEDSQEDQRVWKSEDGKMEDLKPWGYSGDFRFPSKLMEHQGELWIRDRHYLTYKSPLAALWRVGHRRTRLRLSSDKDAGPGHEWEWRRHGERSAETYPEDGAAGCAEALDIGHRKQWWCPAVQVLSL